MRIISTNYNEFCNKMYEKYSENRSCIINLIMNTVDKNANISWIENV